MIRPQSKLLSVLLAVVSVIPAMILLATFNTSSIDRSIARSHEIEREFAKAVTLVDDFYIKNSRLPTQEEFHTFASLSESSPLQFSPPPFDTSIVTEAGKPPPNGYLLEYWRGEWMERYVSWTRRSTLKFDASQYFLFHSQLAEAALMFGLASLCIVISAWAWPNKRASTVLGQNFASTD